MAKTVAAMKAELGSTRYYILSMKAQELVQSTIIPKEMPEWDDLSIEERYQRDINYNRVRKQITPYLVREEDRFFGSIILAALNFDDSNAFEPLPDVMQRQVPNLYRTVASSMGFLTLTGGEILVPLDGQHRLKAIEFALSGKDERDRPIDGITPSTKLAQEDVTIILIPYEQSKARKIFTHVNRYAKPTTTGQNIITDDDDICAVITRRVANDVIGGRLAKYTSNTIRPNDGEFTTLSIIYNCNKDIIEKTFSEKINTTELPDKDKQRLWEDKCVNVWETVVQNITVFADALMDKEETGDERRREIRAASLLGRPVAQECLVKAFVDLTGPSTNMSVQVACDKLNGLPWSLNEENLKVWDRLLWTGGVDGRAVTKNRSLALRLILYLAGKKLSETEKSTLLDDYRSEFPEGIRKDLVLP